MLLTSCGVALHHVRVAIAGARWGCAVTRPVVEATDELLATVRLTEPTVPGPGQAGLALAVRSGGGAPTGGRSRVSFPTRR